MEKCSMTDEHLKAPEHTASRRRMTVFFSNERVNLDPEIMPIKGMDESVMAGLSRLSATGVDPNSGAKAMLLFREPGDQGMSLSYVWLKSGFIHPRHSHNTDCLYYVLGGELRLGSRTLKKGDGLFVPADAAYTYEAGPGGVEVLEFRNATRFDLAFKGNDMTHWNRMAEAISRNAPAWAEEAIPPSCRSTDVS
jgi:quercetin dioxygenase-like cupin family protein